MEFQWKGVFPALTTPLTGGDELDLEMLAKSIESQLQAGVDGIILGGSLGEASVLTTAEKEVLVRNTVKLVDGQVPVILNIAEGSTRDAIRQAGLAGDWGADGVMLLPPMRYRPDHRETVSFFRAVATSTNLPILLYNNPVDYGTGISLGMFAELADVSNIQAVKESTRDVTNVTRMRNCFGDRFRILCGVDTLAFEELCLGADGWVAGLVCAFPRETVELYQLIIKGELEQARQLYRWFLPLLELDIHPKLVQYIKLAQSLTGLGTEYVREPRLQLEGEERERILKIIRGAIQNRRAVTK